MLMDAIGVLPPEQMRLLWQDFLTRQQLGPQLKYNFPDRRPLDEVSPHRVKVKNTGSEVIPSFACMRVIGVEDIGGNTCVRVEKPTSTDGEFLFNGPYEIAVAADATDASPVQLGVGWAYRHGVVTMLGDEPTEPGAAFGPIVGSWEIEEGGDKFVVFGRHDFSERALVGRFNAGSGGGHTIWFEISQVLCPGTDYVEETTLVVDATWYTGGCSKVPPGANDDGTYNVYDICNFTRGLTPTDLAAGVGKATYMYPLTGACEPRWIIDELCPQPEC